MRITILGCGSSPGVPFIGCDCIVCTSSNSKNKRSRVSILIEINGKNILVDSSPDLRQQALRHNIRCIDAVLYTHEHADHAHGIDDLRSFNYLSGDSIPVYGDEQTITILKQRFEYAFQPKPENTWIRPALVAREFGSDRIIKFDIFDNIQCIAFHQCHGKTKTIGYRIDNFAYSTDVDNIPDESFKALEGIEVWVVDCLRYTPSYSHSYLARTLEWIERVKPRMAVFTHMSHEFDYDILSKELPSGVVPGYDGMVIEC